MTTQKHALEVYFRLLAEKAEDAIERSRSMQHRAAGYARRKLAADRQRAG